MEMSGQMVCEDCLTGTYQPELFGDQCMDCPTGYDTRQSGSERPEDCESEFKMDYLRTINMDNDLLLLLLLLLISIPRIFVSKKRMGFNLTLFHLFVYFI